MIRLDNIFEKGDISYSQSKSVDLGKPFFIRKRRYVYTELVEGRVDAVTAKKPSIRQ